MGSTDHQAASVRQVLDRIRGLQRQRERRDAEGVFWIEGIRQFLQAADGGFEFEGIVHSPVLQKNSLVEKMVRELTVRGVRRIRVSPEEFRAVGAMEHASGIGAIVRQRWTPIERASPYRGLCWLAMEMLRSAGNLGTILRTAEATGVAGVIFLSTFCDPFDPAVVRASMGGVFHLQMVRANTAEVREWARRHGVRLVGLSPTAEPLWTAVRAGEPMALVIGEERKGLSGEASELCDVEVRLPMSGRSDSLNVGVAAGVMMYELVRQGTGAK